MKIMYNMNMRSFKLLGKTVKIVYSKDLEDKADAHGLWEDDKQVITLQSGMSQDQELHTLWHEITHAILDTMNEDKLSKNEKFVDLFGGLLHQVVSTLK